MKLGLAQLAPKPQLLHSQPRLSHRRLVTLAIESSCDDTCVAIVEKSGAAARLLFNAKVTADNNLYQGVHPAVAVASHSTHLARLVQEAVQTLPEDEAGNSSAPALMVSSAGSRGTWTPRRRPDFVSVTRGPGMGANLATGINTAKGLAVAWHVPLVGAHHMQAHALTPRLVTALAKPWPHSLPSSPTRPGRPSCRSPDFPFLSLLVSGGHTQLMLSASLTRHEILAAAHNIAIGDMLDKCARAILPAHVLASAKSYGAALERFAHSADSDAPTPYCWYSPPLTRAAETSAFVSINDAASSNNKTTGAVAWSLLPPLHRRRNMVYDFASLNGDAQKIASALPQTDLASRRLLARATMKLAFEHLASRVVFALQQRQNTRPKREGEQEQIQTLVLSGGVASNAFLRHVLRSVLDVRGFGNVAVVAPPPALCTDNAAMIAWCAMEMWEAGWQSDLGLLARKKWSLDPGAEDGGILGADGWVKRERDRAEASRPPLARVELLDSHGRL